MRLWACCLLASGLAQGAPPEWIAVVNRAENTVSIIDPSGKRETVKLPTGAAPHEAAACGNSLLVSNYGAQTPGSSISVYDAAGRRLRATVDVAPLLRPHGMACAGEYVYFTAEANLAIGRIRLETARFDAVIGHGQKTGHMIARPTQPDVFYTANITSGTVARIAKASGPGGFDVTVAKAGQSPEGIDVSPDGKQVWAANRGDSTISVIDTTTMQTVASLPTPKFAFRLRFTPDGMHVLATIPEAGAVMVFDAQSRKESGRVAVDGTPLSVAVSADGRLAYVVVGGADRVVEIDLQDLKIARSFPTGAGPDSLAISDR
jgi:YVTN family beta-propeller protein